MLNLKTRSCIHWMLSDVIADVESADSSPPDCLKDILKYSWSSIGSNLSSCFNVLNSSSPLTSAFSCKSRVCKSLVHVKENFFVASLENIHKWKKTFFSLNLLWKASWLIAIETTILWLKQLETITLACAVVSSPELLIHLMNTTRPHKKAKV